MNEQMRMREGKIKLCVLIFKLGFENGTVQTWCVYLRSSKLFQKYLSPHEWWIHRKVYKNENEFNSRCLIDTFDQDRQNMYRKEVKCDLFMTHLQDLLIGSKKTKLKMKIFLSCFPHGEFLLPLKCRIIFCWFRLPPDKLPNSFSRLVCV
jgi:hypothetical protein